MGLFRRGSDDTLRLIERNPTSDPAAVAKHVLVYCKDVAGITQLFARASDGTVSQLTPGATIPPATDIGNRSQIRRGGADVLRVLEIAADPAAAPGKILLYGKNVAGVTQLFTCDDSGAILQITPHLTTTPSGGAASSEVRRDGSEILSIIGRTDDATAIANSDLLYGKIVGSFVQLFVRLSDGTVALLSEGPLNTTGAKPGQVYAVDSSNTPAWGGNFPYPTAGNYWEYENGGAGILGLGLNAWQNSPVGAGAQRLPLTGEAGWFPNACSFETGTTTTGANSASRQAGVGTSASSGLFSYSATFSLPVLSTNAESYYFSGGYLDNVNPTLVVNGVYFAYTHDTNGGRLQFITSQNSIRTVIDTGITVVAGNYYHIRVTILNNTLAACYIKTIFSGGTYSDDGVWGAPAATLSTNIPTSNAQLMGSGLGILKRAGTTSRLYKMGVQLNYHVSTFTPSGNIVAGTGLQKGDIATGIAVDPSANPAWLAPLRILEPPILFYAYGRGGWIPSASPDFFQEVGGTGGTGGFAGIALDNGMFGNSNAATGTGAADGYCFYHTSYTLNLDTYVQPMVIESVFRVPILSTLAEKFKATLGLFDSVATVLTNGITFEIDSNANTHAQCVCTAGGVATTVDSGLVISAGVDYLFRIIITSTSVSFYVVQNGVTTLTTPVATITTNIPTAVSLATGVGIRKLAGTTSRSINFGYVLAFQRSA